LSIASGASREAMPVARTAAPNPKISNCTRTA